MILFTIVLLLHGFFKTIELFLKKEWGELIIYLGLNGLALGLSIMITFFGLRLNIGTEVTKIFGSFFK